MPLMVPQQWPHVPIPTPPHGPLGPFRLVLLLPLPALPPHLN